MTSSPKAAGPTPDAGKAPLLVAEAGVPYRAAPEGDPFEAWIDLMEAVEALCPQWPRRAPTIGRDYRL